MKAGRDMDALVAREVFGSNVYFDKDEMGDLDLWRYEDGGAVVEKYSTEIEPAFEVVEKIKNHRGFYDFTMWWDDQDWNAGWVEHHWDGVERNHCAEASTLPLAICLAALKALNVSLPKK